MTRLGLNAKSMLIPVTREQQYEMIAEQQDQNQAAPSRPDDVYDLPVPENGDLAAALRDNDPD